VCVCVCVCVVCVLCVLSVCLHVCVCMCLRAVVCRVCVGLVHARVLRVRLRVCCPGCLGTRQPERRRARTPRARARTERLCLGGCQPRVHAHGGSRHESAKG